VFEQFVSRHVKYHHAASHPLDLTAQRIAVVFQKTGIDAYEAVVLEPLAQFTGHIVVWFERIVEHRHCGRHDDWRQDWRPLGAGDWHGACHNNFLGLRVRNASPAKRAVNGAHFLARQVKDLHTIGHMRYKVNGFTSGDSG